jgi:hypothetical protein
MVKTLKGRDYPEDLNVDGEIISQDWKVVLPAIN